MPTWEQEQLDVIKPLYPEWDMWLVQNFIGPATFCARPKGHPVATINAFTPEDFIAALAEAEREMAK